MKVATPSRKPNTGPPHTRYTRYTRYTIRLWLLHLHQLTCRTYLHGPSVGRLSSDYDVNLDIQKIHPGATHTTGYRGFFK
jgi:hypothetical protein